MNPLLGHIVFPLVIAFGRQSPSWNKTKQKKSLQLSSFSVTYLCEGDNKHYLNRLNRCYQYELLVIYSHGFNVIMQKRYNTMYHFHDSGSAWLVWQCKLCYWLIKDTSMLCEKAIRLVNNGSLYQKLRDKKEWEQSWLNASWMVDALWPLLEWGPSNGTFLLVFSTWEKQPLLAHQPLNARGMDTLPAEMMTLGLEQTHNPLDPQSNTLSWTRCFGKAGVWWSGKEMTEQEWKTCSHSYCVNALVSVTPSPSYRRTRCLCTKF